LLGLRGIVVKSHGGATSDSFCVAISEAYPEVNATILDKISSQVSKELEKK
jgi:glycerol-3-phosphate acyltransferase PlsX